MLMAAPANGAPAAAVPEIDPPEPEPESAAAEPPDPPQPAIAKKAAPPRARPSRINLVFMCISLSYCRILSETSHSDERHSLDHHDAMFAFLFGQALVGSSVL